MITIYCAECDRFIESDWRTRTIARREHAKARHGGNVRVLDAHLNDPMSYAELVHLQQFVDTMEWRKGLDPTKGDYVN